MSKKEHVGLYAGSFNPFHKGHYDILVKAEKIFDRVIIAKGQNPEKVKSELVIPEIIKDREIVQYEGMLTDFIKSLPYEVTLIRGLRNATDLQFELTQYRYFQDFMPDIQVVSLFCDKNLEHISSSAIRLLDSLKQPHDYTL